MSSLRDKLRSATLGSRMQFQRVLVPIRDAKQPRRLEADLTPAGEPVLEQVKDERRQPLFDLDGQPVMQPKQRVRHPPLIGDDGQPMLVEVREPTLKQRAAIYRAAGIASANAERDGIDMAALQVEAVIACTFEPGTEVRVFDERDRPALLAQPAGGFCDDLFEVIQPLLNSSEKEAEKN